MSWYFTNDEKKYLREHYTAETLYQMAKHLNRPKTSVGYHLQTVLKLKVPEEVIIKNRKERKDAADKKHAQRHAEKELLKAVKKQKPVLKKSVNNKTAAIKLPPSIRVYLINKPAKKPQPAAMKIPSTTDLIPLRVDHRTVLYIKPGADTAAILKQYQKKAS